MQHELSAGAEHVKDFETVWVGCLTDEVPVEDQPAVSALLWEQHRAVAVYVPSDVLFGHYDICCKSFLWPLFHYMLSELPSDSRTDKESWDNYADVNKRFSECIASVWRPNDLIIINDYHLMLAPQMTRALVPKAGISFFLHAPFPSSEVFRCLPSASLSFASAFCLRVSQIAKRSFAAFWAPASLASRRTSTRATF